MKPILYMEQVIRPRIECGVDWGATGRVLIKNKEKALVWQGGCTVWLAGYTPRTYVPACLRVEGSGRLGADIHEGGRLSRKLLKTHIKKIRDLMELGDLDVGQIDLKRTMVAG